MNDQEREGYDGCFGGGSDKAKPGEAAEKAITEREASQKAVSAPPADKAVKTPPETK